MGASERPLFDAGVSPTFGEWQSTPPSTHVIKNPALINTQQPDPFRDKPTGYISHPTENPHWETRERIPLDGSVNVIFQAPPVLQEAIGQEEQATRLPQSLAA